MGDIPLHYKLDDDGEPVACDSLQWAYWLDSDDKRRFVAVDDVDGYRISTIFTGCHTDLGDEPVVWATVVFSEENKALLRERCAGKRADALAMHVQITESVRSSLGMTI